MLNIWVDSFAWRYIFLGGVRKHWVAPRQIPALCRHSVDVLMQILPQGLCAHGQGRGQELHSTRSGVCPRIPWHCSRGTARLHSRWKSRESYLATKNWAAEVRTQSPSAGMVLVGCRRAIPRECRSSPGWFPGTGTHTGSAGGGWYRKYDLYFLWVLCQTAKSCIRGNWQGQGKEQKK